MRVFGVPCKIIMVLLGRAIMTICLFMAHFSTLMSLLSLMRFHQSIHDLSLILPALRAHEVFLCLMLKIRGWGQSRHPHIWPIMDNLLCFLCLSHQVSCSLVALIMFAIITPIFKGHCDISFADFVRLAIFAIRQDLITIDIL